VTLEGKRILVSHRFIFTFHVCIPFFEPVYTYILFYPFSHFPFQLLLYPITIIFLFLLLLRLQFLNVKTILAY